MVFYRGRRKKQVVPIKVSAVDTITPQPILDLWPIAPATVFVPPNNANIVRGFVANAAGDNSAGITGGQVTINLFEPIGQQEVTLGGLAGEINFSLASLGAGSNNQYSSISVAFAIVHVRKGQEPSIIAPFTNYPIDVYSPPRDNLAYGTGPVAITSGGGVGGVSSQKPKCFKFEVMTRRCLEIGDRVYLISATNLPMDALNIMQYFYNIRLFLTTN